MIRPGHRARDVRAALEQAREPRGIAHGQHGDRNGRDRRDQRRREAEADGRERRARDRGRGQRGRAAGEEPVHERAHGNPGGERDERDERDQRRNGAQPEPRAPSPGRRLRGRRRASLEARFRAQQHEAERHEHEREHGGGGRVESELVLGVDLGRERAEAEQGEGAVLGEQVQRDDQAPAEQREAQLRQRHAGEDGERSQPLAAGHVLERGVGPPQACDRRQHHERVVRQGADEHGAREAVHAVVEADPRVAVDELGHGQRQREHDRPEAAAGEVGALEQPGDAGADHRAERRHDHDQLDGVAEQLADVRQAQEVQRLRPAGARRLHADERERQEQHGADRQREQPQRRRTGRRRRCAGLPSPIALRALTARAARPAAASPVRPCRRRAAPS